MLDSCSQERNYSRPLIRSPSASVYSPEYGSPELTRPKSIGLFRSSGRTSVPFKNRTEGKTLNSLQGKERKGKHYHNSVQAARSLPSLIDQIERSGSTARNLDWINVMAYDFYAPDRASASGATHSHAALYDSSSDVSASYGIEKWIEGGVSSKKIVIGFPFYGYAWLLTNPNNHGLLAPANGPDLSVGGSDGSIGYNKIKMLIIGQKGATTVFNDTIVADYCYVGTSWIGYDDVRTISTKISYAKGKGLLGYFAWHVGSDDSWVLSKQASQTWGSGA